MPSWLSARSGCSSRPTLDQQLHAAIAVLGHVGRITDKVLITALGSTPGDRLTLDISEDAVTPSRSDNGTSEVDARSQAIIPVSARRRLQITTGDRVLLVALPAADQLKLDPLHMLLKLLTSYYHSQEASAMTTRMQLTERTTLAVHMLEQIGVSPNDLQLAAPTPTVHEYLPRVRAAASPTLRRSYGSYWNRAKAAFGDMPLDQVASSDIQALAQQARECRRENAATQTGRGARLGCMDAPGW